MTLEHTTVTTAGSDDETVLVVLAAGQGTRMRSALPKPLHPVAGAPMITHVVRAGAGAVPARTVLVVGPELNDLAAQLRLGEATITVVQQPRLGTGDAVRRALAVVPGAAWAVVLYADHPLLTAETVARLVTGARQASALVTILTTILPDPARYGRVERDSGGRPVRIVEYREDLPARRAGPTEVNSGMMALNVNWAREALARLQPSSTTGEFYLTDLVALAVADGNVAGSPWPVAAVLGDPTIALGINNRVELAAADSVARNRIRQRLLEDGVTLIGPETIFIDEGVTVGRDTTIYPYSIVRVGTSIGERCAIGPHAVIGGSRLGNDVTVQASTIEDAVIADGADVGPYAHLRAGTELGARVHIGNFAELKNAHLANDVKVGHFSYLGDTTIGAETNIGAGTITANFDGVQKHATTIGERAFIGSDTILRAPVRVGVGARTGAGAIVTKDVPDGATVVGVPARVVKRSGETPKRAIPPVGEGEANAL